jgi:two-component system chemotaxis sensor kinase CheA
MDDLVAEFLAEAADSLQTIDNDLIELEGHPGQSNLIDGIFRVVHSIKGTCGFFGLNKLAAIAHASEDILVKIRSNQLKIDKKIISTILEAIDSIKYIIIYIGKNNGKEPNTDYSELIQKIQAIITNSNEVNTSFKESPVIERGNSEREVSQTVRVNVSALEKLTQMVTELVLDRNKLVQLDRESHDNRFSSVIHNLNSITSTLQEGVMQTRLQPISYSWSSLPRALHDLANSLNKKAKLVMHGESTKLDKQLIEAIKDPMLHMVRNAIDHGIEPPTERIAKGKPEEGVITLTARHNSGHVVIEVSDDGRGMEIAKIKEKILEKSLATDEELSSMSDQQIIQYIFSPGFSTSEVVTNISGRGVGMDVVKENIKALHGIVEISSKEGKGSTIIVIIPLTLAIMSVLLIEVAGKKFALPEANVIEVVEINSDLVCVEEMISQKLLRLRGDLLPSIALSEVLGIPKGLSTFVVVCSVNDKKYGLIIDKVYGIEEIVLKPLSRLIEVRDIYVGNTLLGNNEIVMVLNPGSIMKDCEAISIEKIEEVKVAQKLLPKFLMVQVKDLYKVIAFNFIVKVEKFDSSKVEIIKGKKVIQYNDLIVPVISAEKEDEIQASGISVMLSINNKLLFIVVTKALGVIEKYIESDNKEAIIIDDKIVEIINIDECLRKYEK